MPSKQDNVKRGTLRNGQGLNFQNTVRAISSRIDLAAEAEDYTARVDHDNAGVANSAAFDKYGIYLFVALETSREVAVVDAFGHYELFRFQVGRAPQGLARVGDGLILYVNNFMDRTVGMYDLAPLIDTGVLNVPQIATLNAMHDGEARARRVRRQAAVLRRARPAPRARSLHQLRRLPQRRRQRRPRVGSHRLRRRPAQHHRAARPRRHGPGFLHWSNNFDEVQDFEGQIRALAGGTGLMADADFYAGTRSEPLGDRRQASAPTSTRSRPTSRSLDSFADSPFRNQDGSLTSDAEPGKSVFTNAACGTCHSGDAFTDSGANTFHDVGTLKASSGMRLYGPLLGIDTPTLRDAWETAPYLHDGSASTLSAAVQAHTNVSLNATELAQVAAYVQQIGGQEPAAPLPKGTGRGVRGYYYNNTSANGAPALQRTDRVNFTWSGSPGPGVNADHFSARWLGTLEAPVTGSYEIQTDSDEGIRVWIDGALVIDHLTAHLRTTDTSAAIQLTAGTKYSIRIDYYDLTGDAVAILRWSIPGSSSFAVVPRDRLYAN